MAVRIANINLPLNKRIEIALTSIYGVGRSTSGRVLKKTGINPDKKTSELTEDEISKIRTIIEKELVIEGELKRDIQSGIKRLKDIGCYRGSRHAKNLPVRGQRTKTNARTRKGPRKTMGSGRKPSGLKT
ncbi:MAG: 30S ribosomal protein S13 [Patescibacteria group bacterium]|nr:30S ribosomal protein S13 [Patescibacteria group bacterium]